MVKLSQANIASGPDYSTTIDWSIGILRIPVALPANIITTDEFDLRCESTGVPQRSNQQLQVMIRGFRTNQPGPSLTDETLQLTFKEKVDNRLINFFTQWRDTTYDAQNNGQQVPTADARAQLQLRRLNRQKQVIWIYDIRDALLQTFDPVGGNLSSNAEILTPSMTITYNDFKDYPVNAT